MPKLTPVILLAIALLGLSMPGICDVPNTVKDELIDIVSNTHKISFYYYDKTDQSWLDEKKIKENAIIVIEVNCGFGCKDMLSNVVSNFINSKMLHKCPPKRYNQFKYLLIDLGNNESITYYKGGQLSTFHGKCFFNKHSIDDVIPIQNIFSHG